MIFRPATPGFLVTLTAAILLAVVSFSVPLIKSVFFLKATVDFDGQHGTATFGVLGYCFNTGGNDNCTSPRVGYEFDPNALLGNKNPIQIPEVIVKWLTYALVLHIVALGFAAGSALFGLLAHVREFSMTCCSTCVSGFGAAITLIAFIFDVAFFFLAKARINKIPGGSAQIGGAIWLTLAAWILLFFAGCFYSFGRCCIGNRPRGPRDKRVDPSMPGDYETGHAEALRLDAVKAEADRKARQKQGEIGLPAFNEYDPSKPLTASYDEEDDPYFNHQPKQASGYPDVQVNRGYTGYTPAPPGTSAMDAYYNAPVQPEAPLAATGYPPQPSAHAQYPSTRSNPYDATNAPPSHGQYSSNQSGYGHPAQDTSYYTSASHYQQPSHVLEPSAYNAGGYVPSSGAVVYPSSSTPDVGVASAHNYYPSNVLAGAASQSMGRDDYTFSNTPTPPQPSSNPSRQSPGPRGPRSPTSPTVYSQPAHSDNPPGYEAGQIPSTAWPNEKH